MFLILSLILLAFIFCPGSNSGTIETGYKDGWTHQVTLDPESGMIVKWKNTPEKEDGSQWIIMEMSGNTYGYLGLGFSPKGGMMKADMVIGWVDNEGKAHLKDYHGLDNDNGVPILDESQDYELISAIESAPVSNLYQGKLSITFKRKWDTCDPQDMILKKDTTRLIWAIGQNDPNLDEKFNFNFYHGMNRGVQSVFLSDDAKSADFPSDQELFKNPDVKHWDTTMKNVRVTAPNTTYHCRIEKFTDTTANKHHLIGWEPIIQKENVKRVHHILFYECNVPDDLIPMFDEHTENHPGGNCYTKNMPPEWGKSCTTFLLVWTVGSEGEMLPQHVGAPLGQNHGGATYFMIEMHYENPQGLKFSDNSGVRIFYTDKLRENEGSVMLLGYRHSPFLLIPPKQENFQINGICAKECLEKTLPSTGIHVVTILIHAHLWGKKLRLRHFRNGKELPLIAEDENYDFNYQQSRTLKQEVTILPGDELLTECEYDTMDMDRVVLGGLATTQEICQTFLIYYPKVGVGQCTSQSEFHDFMKGLGIDKVDGEVLSALDMPYDPKDNEFDPSDNAKELEETGDGSSYRNVFDRINVREPSISAAPDLTISVGEHLRRTNWEDKSVGKNVEDFWKKGKHYQFCTQGGSKRIALKNYIISYPIIKEALPAKEDKKCGFVGRESNTSNWTFSSIFNVYTISSVLIGVIILGVIIIIFKLKKK